MSNTACAPTKERINSSLEGRQNAPAYRPDIDGLRAIAVSAVVLFHARFGLSGGFVGVDVFFVISGFLITTLILKDAESAEGFSILKFWERRIRRILPALLVVLVATVIGGWFVLLPSDFQKLGKSVLAQAAFGGNFYFWQSTGYFTEGASPFPLLHTWSLAVEEQFYLFFPLLFLFRSKWKISSLRWVLGLTTIASLFLGIVLTRLLPTAAFFLLPPRAWELLGGALLALAPRKLNIPQWARELLSWSGFLAIGTTFWRYNGNTPFPGTAALLPCVGTLLIIWANGIAAQPSTLGRLLSLRPLVFLGKISYSLYLWHWPLLVYAWYWQENTPLPCFLRVELVVLSLVLATVSWKFVETPFRTRRVLPLRRHLLIFGVASPACCALVGAALVLTHGVPSRFPESVLQYDVTLTPPRFPKALQNSTLDKARNGNFPQVGKPETSVQCLVWGDSHAMTLIPVFDKLAMDASCSVEFAAHYATGPMLDYQSIQAMSLKRASKPWCEAVVENARRKRIPNVVLVARWPLYLGKDISDPSSQEVAEKLKATVIALHGIGAKVWILKTVPEHSRNLPMAMAKLLVKGGPGVIGVSKGKYMESSRLEDEVFAPAVASGAVILDPFPIFFSNRETCLIESSGCLLYRDNNHLSPSGSMMLSDLLRPIFTR